MIKVAHISDLHFSRFSPSPAQFFSKRWLGNLNLLLNRAKEYINERPFSLIPTFKEQGITHVIISGDLTTTSSKQEYRIAKRFVDTLKKEGMKVFLIPGNHDHYTKKADRTKAFYQSFPSPKESSFSLSAHGVAGVPLTEGWHLILMDTTFASKLTSSNGFFSPIIEKNLKKLLKTIDPEQNILLVNHFPFFQHDKPHRRLIRGEKLKAIVSTHPNIQLYLHGHTHRRTIADLRPNKLPLILDSGSTGHRNGSWNLMELDATSLKLTVHKWDNAWNPIDEQIFTFGSKPWYGEGLRFKCTGCGKCCTGKGYVWLEGEDVTNLAKELDLSEEDFLKQYTRQVGFDLALLDDPHSDDCIFLENQKLCKVYKNRPKQCQTFPWWPHNLESVSDWEEAKKHCEGIEHPDAPVIPLWEIKKELNR
ncbi:MAG: metallophosphoesterase [Chlamydiales bacterium]|nr:metallophosphoesterase [Chlamydiales bacterium]